MKKIKGIDTEDKQMRFFPLLEGVSNIELSTKKKKGYIKLHLPDEMLEDIMNMILGRESNVIHEQYIISCRVKNNCCGGCKGEGKEHYNGCWDCFDFSKYEPKEKL